MDIPVTELPAGYGPVEALDFSSGKARIRLTLFGFSLAGAATVTLARISPELRSDWGQLLPEIFTLMGSVPLGPEGMQPWIIAPLLFLALLTALAGVIVLHEILHGAVFWILTRTRPEFGLGPGYAYCAAPPGCFLTRNRFLAVALAPFLVLTSVGLLLVSYGPLLLSLPALVYLVLHTAGTTADLATAAWLLQRPPSVFIWDYGTTTIVYGPVRST